MLKKAKGPTDAVNKRLNMANISNKKVIGTNEYQIPLYAFKLLKITFKYQTKIIYAVFIFIQITLSKLHTNYQTSK